MRDYPVRIYRTSQYGPAVTAAWDEGSSGTYDLDGSFSHGEPLPNYLRGQYELTDADRAAIEAAVARVAATGDTETLLFSAPDELTVDAREWKSPRGLTLSQEMDREDSAY